MTQPAKNIYDPAVVANVKVTAEGSDPVEVGQVRSLVVELSSPIDVICVVLEHRSVYGRNEYLLAPVAGDGAAWVREDKIIPQATKQPVGTPGTKNGE
jgi:hypothetical protein